MPIKILMPALSPTMTHGTLAKWIKKEGDYIKSGEVLAEIETDKATMEIEAVEEGKLGKILVAEGTENIAVNKVIALLLEDGEDASSLKEAGSILPKIPTLQTTPSTPTEVPSEPITDFSSILTSHTLEYNGTRTIASPLAKRLAAKKGLDLSTIKGSGPRGRIIKSDIEAATAGSKPAKNNEAFTSQPFQLDDTPRTTPNIKAVSHTPMRKAIARRLTESARDIPHFNISVDIQIDAMLDARKRLNASVEIEKKISVNDFVIKALSLSLTRVPSCNVSYTDEATLFYKKIDISFAVSIDGGIITPIIKDVANKGFSAIAKETKELVKRARAGELQPNEYEGGTFTVSNMGMLGVLSFNSIINPPQAAILSVGAGKVSPVVTNGVLSTATVMKLTLAVDHRCIDGATAAEFLGELKLILEEPLQFLL